MSEQRRTLTPSALEQHPLAAIDPLGTTRLNAELVETGDPIAAREVVTSMLHAHVLEIVGETTTFGARLARARLAPVELIDISYGSAVRLRRDAIDAYCAIIIPLRGRIVLRSRGKFFVAEPYKTMVVLGDDENLDSEWEADAHALILKIERIALSEAIDLFDHRRRRNLRFETAEITGASGFAMYGAVQLLAHSSEQGSLAAVTSTWRRHLVQHTLFTALLALPHSLSAELGRTETIRSATIRHAVERVHAEDSAELSVPDLANLLGVGVRALELGFRHELDTTPREFLRSTRLRRAREELRLADPESTTVSVIANKWGFAHHGRFASLYRERYGEQPATTLHS